MAGNNKKSGSGHDDFFSGFFDFDGNGKTTIDEEWIAYKILEDIDKETKKEDETRDYKKHDNSYGSYDYYGSQTNDPKTKTDNIPAAIPYIPDVSSFEKYKANRKIYTRGFVQNIVLGIFLELIPIMIIVAAFVQLADKGGVGAIFILLVSSVQFYFIRLFFKMAKEAAVENYDMLNDIKDAFLESAEDVDKKLYEEYNIQRTKKKHILVGVTVGILAALLTLFIVVKAVNYNKIDSIYKEAETLIEQEKYEEAIPILKSIEDEEHKDTKALIVLCRSHKFCNDNKSGYSEVAYEEMKKVSFKYQSQEQLNKISAFRNYLNEEHEKEEALKREKEVESYNRELQSARKGVPYVGMPESWIRITALGSPSEYVHEGSEYINGHVYYAYTYYFVENGKVIFEARCVLGKVVEVKDKRNNKTTSGGSGKVSSSKSSMPSVDEYSDPEEFYYWNIDDFYDYEDAEEYYYSHGGR